MTKDLVWEHWELEHLSPAAINLWIASPARFVAAKIAGVKFPPSVAEMQQVGVKAGLVALAHDRVLAIDEAAGMARAVLAAEIRHHGVDPDDAVAQRALDHVTDCIRVGADAIRQHGIPLSPPCDGQDPPRHKLELHLGLGIPLVGYPDLKYLSGVVGIQTVAHLPTSIAAAQARELSLWAAATGQRAAALYVSPEGVSLLEVDHMDQHLATLRVAACRLAGFLSRFADKEQLLAACPPPDLASPYWSSPTEHAIAQGLFGISF
jgi:hypothetical protein